MSLVRADAIALPLADESVDLIVTSPPYFALRSYTDGGEHYDGQIGSEPTPQAFLEALWAVTAECRRVLKPSGSMFVNLGDKYAGSRMDGSTGFASYPTDRPKDGKSRPVYERRQDERLEAQVSAGGMRHKSLMGLPWRYAIGCIDQLDLILRAEIVWSKPNGLPESVTDRVRRSHEQWFHMVKSPRYYAAVDEVREPSQEPKQATRSDSPRAIGQAGVRSYGDSTPVARVYNPLGKLPGSVWELLDSSPWEQLLLSGQVRFCPKCGRDLTAGNGPRTRIRLATAEPSAPTAASSTSTASPTNCSSAPSPKGSPSTTCAATEDAATPPTSKSSPGARTSSAAGSHSKPIASTGTASTTPTKIDGATVPSVASAAPVIRSACVCETLDWPPNVAPSVWTVPSEPLRVPDWLGVDHFAAFPQELPRRLILGWSPPGICTACGEGRRPIVEREKVGGRIRTHADTPAIGAGRKPSGHMAPGALSKFTTEATITGYACACPDTSAPTRPSVILDPFGGTGTVAMVARALGRYPVHIDLSADYLKLARWRIYESGHARKSEARTARENQGVLL